MPLQFLTAGDPTNGDGTIVVKVYYLGGDDKPTGQIEVFMPKTADGTQPFPDELRRSVPTKDIRSLIDLAVASERKYALAPKIELDSGIAWNPDWGPMPG